MTSLDFAAAVRAVFGPRGKYNAGAAWQVVSTDQGWHWWARIVLAPGRPAQTVVVNPYRFQIRGVVCLEATTEADFVAGVRAILDAWPNASMDHTGDTATAELLFRMGLLDHLLDSDRQDLHAPAVQAACNARRRVAELDQRWRGRR